MKTNKIIINEMEKSKGHVKVVKVPEDSRPTIDALIKLESEISSQVDANKAMSNRSIVNASKAMLQ